MKSLSSPDLLLTTWITFFDSPNTDESMTSDVTTSPGIPTDEDVYMHLCFSCTERWRCVWFQYVCIECTMELRALTRSPQNTAVVDHHHTSHKNHFHDIYITLFFTLHLFITSRMLGSWISNKIIDGSFVITIVPVCTCEVIKFFFLNVANGEF